MKRRTFFSVLGGAAVGWPLATSAQQQKVWRVGCLSSGRLASLDSFRQRMTDLGYIEGKNLVLDSKAADGQYDRLPGLAKEIVDRHPDVIVAEATPAIAAAQQATKTIPIIMAPSTDPIGSGFVDSFARPGRNITGVANMFGDLTAKSLEILHRVLTGCKNDRRINVRKPDARAPVRSGEQWGAGDRYLYASFRRGHTSRSGSGVRGNQAGKMRRAVHAGRPLQVEYSRVGRSHTDPRNLPVWLLRRDGWRTHELWPGHTRANRSCSRLRR